MLEVAVRTKVERFQACSGKHLQQSPRREADRVPGQAESTARLQLPTADRQCIADDRRRNGPASADAACPRLPWTTPYGASATRHQICAFRRAPPTGVCHREDREGNGPIPADRITSASCQCALTPHRAQLERVLQPLAAPVGPQVRRVASTAFSSASTPAALHPSIIAVLSVVPRPQSELQVETVQRQDVSSRPA